MLDIFRRPGYQVVQREYAVALIEQVFTHVRADKSGAARNHISQTDSSVLHGTFSPERMLDPTWPEVAILLTLTAVSVFLFLRRLVPVRANHPKFEARSGLRAGRTRASAFRDFVWEVLLQGKVIRERPLPGIAHAFVFWGFLAFALVSINHFANGFGRSLFTERQLIWQLLLRSCGTVCMLVFFSMVGLGIRRFIVQPKWLGTVSLESGIITVLILVLMVTYLFGLWRVAGRHVRPRGPTGGCTRWRLLVFLPLIPHTKHLHLLLSPATIFLSRGSFSRIPPLVGDEDFGIDTGKDITNIVALQAFSCVECGRCTQHCPANNTGKLLDPKKVILGVREYLRDHGANGAEPIVGKYVPEKMLWQCTSCGACEYQCPVGIEHLPIIIGLRRGQVNTGKWEDEQGGKLFLNLERNGNALGMAASERDKFIQKKRNPNLRWHRRITASGWAAWDRTTREDARSSWRSSRCSGISV